MSATLSHAAATPAPAAPAAAARERALAVAASALLVLLLLAAGRHWGANGADNAALRDPWLLLHLGSVLPALPIGVLVMAGRKGGRRHRTLGRVWGMLMLVAAASSLALGRHWSPIHLLSLVTLLSVPAGVMAARRGDIRTHRRAMGVLFASLMLAGFFTLLPMRLLGSWLFDGA